MRKKRCERDVRCSRSDRGLRKKSDGKEALEKKERTEQQKRKENREAKAQLLERADSITSPGKGWLQRKGKTELKWRLMKRKLHCKKGRKEDAN